MKDELKKQLDPTLENGKETAKSQNKRIKFVKVKFTSLSAIAERFRKKCQKLDPSDSLSDEEVRDILNKMKEEWKTLERTLIQLKDEHLEEANTCLVQEG